MTDRVAAIIDQTLAHLDPQMSGTEWIAGHVAEALREAGLIRGS